MKNKLPFIALALFVLCADQLSKWAVTQHVIRPALGEESTAGFLQWITSEMPRLPYAEINIFPFFNLVMVWNQGISFGLFAQDSETSAWILVGLSVVITLLFLGWLFKTSSQLQSIGICLVIGGAIGNVIDRIRFGAVIDFLDFHAFGYHYPAFNIADSCVVVGVLSLIAYSIFFEKIAHKQGEI